MNKLVAENKKEDKQRDPTVELKWAMPWRQNTQSREALRFMRRDRKPLKDFKRPTALGQPA